MFEVLNKLGGWFMAVTCYFFTWKKLFFFFLTERIYVGSRSHRFWLIGSWLCCPWAVLGKHTAMYTYSRVKLPISQWPPNDEVIRGWTHWVDQSPHDPITSQWLHSASGDQAFNKLVFVGWGLPRIQLIAWSELGSVIVKPLDPLLSNALLH